MADTAHAAPKKGEVEAFLKDKARFRKALEKPEKDLTAVEKLALTTLCNKTRQLADSIGPGVKERLATFEGCRAYFRSAGAPEVKK